MTSTRWESTKLGNIWNHGLSNQDSFFFSFKESIDEGRPYYSEKLGNSLVKIEFYIFMMMLGRITQIIKHILFI